MAPSDILLSSSEIDENQGVGTIVGNLAATDPNDSDGTGSYTFSLVEGEGLRIMHSLKYSKIIRCVP